MPEGHYSFEELIGMVDSNDYQTSHSAAGALTLVPRDVASKVTGECLFLRFEVDGAYLPASILAGRSVVGFASDFFEKNKNNPAKRTEIILCECAHHILGHQKGWEHKDRGEGEEASALAQRWLAEWATP